MMSRIDSWHWKISTSRYFQNGCHNTAKNPTLSDIIKIWYVGRLWCPELITDIEKFLPVAIFKMATTILHNISNFDDIGQCWIFVAILKMATAKIFSMSGINSGYHNLPTYEISLKSNSWICAVLWWPFWKWRPVEIFQCQVWIRDIIIYPHTKCRWNRTMLNFSKFDMWVDNDVPNWFLTLKNFYRSLFSKWLPQYPKKSNIVRYHQNLICG
jgi:hypothetical protein